MRGLAPWALKAALRLQQLSVPGAYSLKLVVTRSGERYLIVENAGQPHKLEVLGNGSAQPEEQS